MSNTEKAENIIKGLLSFCEPSEVIMAIRNELYHNDRYFSDFSNEAMESLAANLEKQAKNAHKMLHGE